MNHNESPSLIGPISLEAWKTMKMLKNNVKRMKERNADGSYDVMIQKESAYFKSMIDEANGREAA
jgi:hypothetical protein